MGLQAVTVQYGVQVFKWDGVAVKNALDDAVREVMTVRLPYLENHGLMDGRLAICAVAVATAMFALLWDFLYPFPKVSGVVSVFGDPDPSVRDADPDPNSNPSPFLI